MTKEFHAFPNLSSLDDGKAVEKLLGNLAVREEDGVNGNNRNDSDRVDVEGNNDYNNIRDSLIGVTESSREDEKKNLATGNNDCDKKRRIPWDEFVRSVFHAPQLAVGSEGTEEQEKEVSTVMTAAASLARQINLSEHEEEEGDIGSVLGLGSTTNTTAATIIPTTATTATTMGGGGGMSTSENWMKVVLNVCRHMGGSFRSLPLHRLDPVSFPYYIQAEDAKKNVSWKRKKHQNMPSVSMETLLGLNDALYLAQASFVHTVEDVKIALSNYEGPKYELLYCLTAAKPYMPAHYLAVRKDDGISDAAKSEIFNLKDHAKKKKPTRYLDVLFSVRGTKTMDDYLTDMLVETCDYRGGRSHHGISASGINIYNKHKDLIFHLLKASGREKVRLTFVGHSLGAGTASIACIEFNENHPDLVEASCIGFGCPPILDAQQSERWKDKITTVVNDSDMIPRMHPATLVNLFIDILEFDYTEYAIDDVNKLADQIQKNTPLLLPEEKRGDFVGWFAKQMARNSKRMKERGIQRKIVELFPPGRCIHMYKDGVGISCVEVPCTFFDELDATRTMVDNHQPPTRNGYYWTLLEAVRFKIQNPHFRFDNDLLSLPTPANTG